MLFLVAAAARAGDGPFAVSFDGVDDYVFTPHLVSYNASQLTVTAWIRTTQTAGEVGLVNKYVAGSLNGWNVFLFNGDVRAWYFRDSANFVWDGARGLNGGSVADGQWHHIAFVVGTVAAALYVDGSVRALRGWTGTPGNATTTQELRLGSYPGSGFYRGFIDEVTLWTRALTTAEISNVRSNSLLGTEQGLRDFGLYFRFTEGTGTRVANTAFNNEFRAGRLTNGVLWVPGVLLKPGVATLPPNAVTSRSGRMNGMCSPGGTNASGWFEWDTTTNLGNATPAQPLGGGGEVINFLHSLTGLTVGVTIHYRAVASNALGVARGTNASFTPIATSMTQERSSHTATLLPNGKVLVAGGYGESINGFGFSTNSAELFDPATGLWTPTRPMNTNHSLHTATLLLNGTVLVVDAAGAEVYDHVTETWTRIRSPIGPHNVHTATLLQNGTVLVAGGFGGLPEVFDPATGNWTTTGPMMRVPHDRHTATLLPNGKVLVAGGDDVINGFDVGITDVQLYDPVSRTWTNTGRLNVPRMTHTATLQPNGQVLVVGGTDGTNYLNTAERYDPSTGTWTKLGAQLSHRRGYHTATLTPRGTVLVVGGVPASDPVAEELVPTPDGEFWFPVTPPDFSRWGHTATLLPGGRILLAGGQDDNSGTLASAEIFDPHVGIFEQAAPMSVSRNAHTSTLLPDGRVLLAGFGNSEIFNPTNNALSNALPLKTPRLAHSATLLRDGRVLVAGGSTNFIDAIDSVELFNPQSGAWSNATPLRAARSAHTATLLLSGKVLVAGGVPGGLFAAPVASAEIFDPATGLWTAISNMTSRRVGHSATLLPNGKVLVAGGTADGFGANSLTNAEVFDPATGIWTPTAPMATPRSGHRATLLPNGTVLAAGGIPGSFNLAVTNAEIFDPVTETWSPTAPMSAGRQNHTATLMPDGRVLAVGGSGQGYLASAEYYDPAARSWHAAGAKAVGTASHAATLLPDGRVLVTGGTPGGAALNTNTVELFDPGLGFQTAWQPIITNAPAQLAPGDNLALRGLRFRGVSTASYGTDKDSASDVPLVHLRSLDYEQAIFLSTANWSANSYTSAPVLGLFPGRAVATLFVNGTPTTSSIIEITAPAPPPALAIVKLPPASLRLSWPSSAAGFTLQFNTSLDASNWTAAASQPVVTGGNNVVTNAATGGRKFYRLFKP